MLEYVDLDSTPSRFGTVTIQRDSIAVFLGYAGSSVPLLPLSVFAEESHHNLDSVSLSAKLHVVATVRDKNVFDLRGYSSYT